MAADIQHGRASFSRSVLLCIRRKAEGDYILSYHMDTAYARAKATKSGVCRPKPVTPLRHCRTLVKRRPRPAGALYVSGERIGFIVCDEKFLRLLLRIDQPGLEPAQGFLRIGDGVEEQQIFLGDLLHLVFILSKPPQDLGTALIIHKGRAKFCLNLSRYPRFCKKFKNQHKIAGISEKTKKIQGLLPEKMEMAKKAVRVRRGPLRNSSQVSAAPAPAGRRCHPPAGRTPGTERRSGCPPWP